MKFTKIILIAVIFISFSHASRNIRPLNEIYEFVSEKFASAPVNPFSKVLRMTSVDCIKNKLNLDDENQVTTFEKGVNAIVTANIICIKDKRLFWSDHFAKLIKEAKSDEFKEKIECVKYELSKSEPTSVLLQGFNADVNNELSNCDVRASIDAKALEKYPKISGTSCPTTPFDEYTVGVIKEIILANGNPSEEAVSAVREEFIADNIKKGDDFFKCVMDEMKYEN